MKKNYNEVVLNKIATLLPAHIKTSEFLMDTLDIGRESAYRRIRNEVPFTLDEVARLSASLNFSIDEIISVDNSNGALLIKSFLTLQHSSHSVMYNIMEDYHRFLTKEDESDQLEISVAANQLFFLFFVDHLPVLKFFYYEWMRQNSEISLNIKFSEIELPSDIIYIAQKVRDSHRYIKKLTLIFDENIFYFLFKKIQHFYFRKLITEQELNLLKDELKSFLEFIERLSQDGKNPYGADGLLYLSSLNIANNQLFVKRKSSAASAFFITPVIPLIMTHPEVAILHEKWLNSLKKYSVLITASNEIYQTEYFAKQYGYLKKLEEGIL